MEFPEGLENTPFKKNHLQCFHEFQFAGNAQSFLGNGRVHVHRPWFNIEKFLSPRN
jgi:hypothetical protein